MLQPNERGREGTVRDVGCGSVGFAVQARGPFARRKSSIATFRARFCDNGQPIASERSTISFISSADGSEEVNLFIRLTAKALRSGIIYCMAVFHSQALAKIKTYATWRGR